jgi:aldehyde dehydrogenase (NAD+)
VYFQAEINIFVKKYNNFNKKVTMITIADQFGMKEALAQLGVNINEGTSTGQNPFQMVKF